MKIVSWNILANEFIKKKDYPMIATKLLFNRKTRLQTIITILTKIDADVILLQEVMQAEYNALSLIFKKAYHLIQGKTLNWYNKKSYSGNVTLLKKTMFPSAPVLHTNADKEIEFGLYLKCQYEASPISLNKNKTNLLANLCNIDVEQPPHIKKEQEQNTKKKYSIDIINVHLDDVSHSKRLREIKSIEEDIYKANKVILGGDFNQDYKATSQLYKFIHSSLGLNKPYIKDPTYYIEKQMSIDHIMVKGFSNNKNTNGCVVNNYGDAILDQFIAYGSDHLPVIVQV